jgi:hypothetical protein
MVAKNATTFTYRFVRRRPSGNSEFIRALAPSVGTTIANLGMTDAFPHPLFENHTVHCTTEVVGKRESKSRPNARPVEFHRRAYNQDHTLVAECSHGVRRGQLRIECDRRLLMALRYRTKVLISCPVLGPQQRCRNGASVATRM